MKVSEIFESLQGEGPLMGRPMLFIRMAGCNLSCEWCDTKYAWEGGNAMDTGQLVDIISSSELEYVCWTGGEPLLQADEIIKVIKRTMHKRHCLETNGTMPIPYGHFEHVVASPKDLCEDPPVNADFYKFVLDGDASEFEDVDNYAKDHSIEREKVFIQPKCSESYDALEAGRRFWELCVKYGFSLSPRLHIIYFGSKRGV